MFPRLTPIHPNIVDRIKNTNPLTHSRLNVFVRVISGTGDGLIMISNPDWKIFAATGEKGASFYGNDTRSGTIGVDWNGKAVNVDDENTIDVPFKPSPIVTSVNIKEGKDQISRHCELKFTAFTLGQVELLQKYCMEPGHSLCIEFGYNTNYGFSGLIRTDDVNKLAYRIGERNLDNALLNTWRTTTRGEYDTFFGFIVGGSVNANGDAFDVNIKLRGVPGLPTYMQSQFNIKPSKDGKVSNSDAELPFTITDLNLEAADQMAERRFKYMFNELPKTRQTTEVKNLLGSKTDGFSSIDFINFDPVIENQISIYRDGRTINAFGGQSGSAAGLPEQPTGTNSTSTTNTSTDTTGQQKAETQTKVAQRSDEAGKRWEMLNNIAKKWVEVNGNASDTNWTAYVNKYTLKQADIDEAIRTRTEYYTLSPNGGSGVPGPAGITQGNIDPVTKRGPAIPADGIRLAQYIRLKAFPPEPAGGTVSAAGFQGGFTAAPTGQATATEIMLAGGIALPKEKLFSKNKYIRFAKAVQILNANSELKQLAVSTIPINVIIDIENTKIGAFEGIYSTKPESLLIPGRIPDFSQFFMESNLQELTNDEKLIDMGIPTGNPDNPTIQFAQPKELDADGYKEGPYKWGYLENLYINFDFFKKELEKPNRTMKDVLQSLLNEMSLAVNSFWNFQIAESTRTYEVNKIKEKTTVYSVYDENWVGKKNVEPPTFVHSGEESRFLQADLSIEIAGAMMNKIIAQRLSLASNPDQKDIALGGCFSTSKDRFIQSYVASAKAAGGGATKTPKEEEQTPKTKVGGDNPTELDKKLQDAVNASKGKVSPEQEKKAQEISAKQGNLSKLKENVDKLKADYAAAQKAYDDNNVFFPSDAEVNARKKAEQDKARLEKEIATAEGNYKVEEGNLNKEAEDYITGLQQAASANISNNLNKIDVVPNPTENTLTQGDLNNFINDIALFRSKFRVYCCRDAKFLNVLKTNKLPAKLGSGTMSPPLPIKYTFTILGRSGIRRGDTFNIIGIPKKYRDHGFFQVTEVEHTIQDMKWTTRVQGEYRQIQ